MPVYRRIRTRKQNSLTLELAKKMAEHSFPFQVTDSRWATKECFTEAKYQNITKELVDLDKSIGYKLMGGVLSSLHWSRRYEYPYTVINSKLPNNPPKDFRIIDCGAGAGPLQLYFGKRGIKYYAFDQDLFSLRRVARFKTENNLNTLYPTYGNILDIPFPDNQFDRVFCISTLEHILEPLKDGTEVVLKGFLYGLLRILKPNGILVLTFDVNMSPKKSPHRLYPGEHQKMCKILGILPEQPPQNRLYSSDTKAGQIMGTDLSVFCTTIKKCGN
ncbi:MAG: class I SAM-dependent methyltransferase [Candidatus Bathyarchaeia archaeon]